MAILRHWTLIAACYALVTHYAVGASSHRHDKTSDMDADVTYMYIVVSAAVIVTSITIIAMCNWCYGQKYSPYDDTSGITQNEMVVGNSYIDIGDLSALNVDSLESNDPIRIEPLPDVSVRTHKPNSTGSLSTVSGYLSHLQLPRTQLNYVAEIGSGWFGKVLTGEAHKLQTGLKKTKVIIKQLKDDATSDEKNQFLLEVQPYR
ncbi:uncharacterized protein LOC102808698 [Saccoglossus kowalevskii]|uniref:Serine/threonine-protein kinase LMTK1-like n=1 Tax=Saccoglossus kowalevskii TaxID=10224 RepID=A0ABM0M0L3_SACKO|nr:PREDICTED: serine/threonine-protein kinase LMTK1-like [Saccoglossus kowalevskii]